MNHKLAHCQFNSPWGNKLPMNTYVTPSFLGPIEIHWSEHGLEKIDIRKTAKPTQSTHDLPKWLSKFIHELDLYLNKGTSFSKLPPLNESKWTDFQKLIYQNLFATRPGETLTYGELAKLCSRPKAARSVGAAMRRNTLPILIPCHRVLPAGGKIGNYTGGEGPLSKEKLLKFEQGFADSTK